LTTETEKQLYEQLSSVLEALQCIFDTDKSYTETNLYASLDTLRDEEIYLGCDNDDEDDDSREWHAYHDLCRAMQGLPVKSTPDWGNLEFAAGVMKEAFFYLRDYEERYIYNHEEQRPFS